MAAAREGGGGGSSSIGGEAGCPVSRQERHLSALLADIMTNIGMLSRQIQSMFPPCRRWNSWDDGGGGIFVVRRNMGQPARMQLW